MSNKIIRGAVVTGAAVLAVVIMRVCLASGAGDTTPINCASKVIRDS
jgi:hypothetical protein